MKKSLVICAGLCAVIALTGCGKSKQSAYRAAYDRALAENAENVQTQPVQTQVPVVTPVQTQPVQAQPVVTDNYDNVPTRTESLQLINGAGLKTYSVVVGSFGVKANAEGLQSTLKAAGYDAQIAFNAGNSMYRVIASTFNEKGAAVQSRDQLRSKYADAWLLYNK
ncbi:MAG: SPOR domain-containing protein [Prevotella sp.]|jgi:cell division septation protein DedD|nr:SPOR domain-containing protein [Prevotella sp.]MBQ9533238.1 SPOR domain-containing protein [Prevotella sp.]